MIILRRFLQVIIKNGIIMMDVICTDEGGIDWPEPNMGTETTYAGYSADGMPDEVFDIWLDECYELADSGVDD